ncbi:PH domain-containing protein [Porphyromonadaceae bacterium W3.11]|nr:PH domain-containing protein [Porphyromonadaceae bacterium W3.11]
MKVPEDYINPEIGIDRLPPVTDMELNRLDPKFYYQMLLSASIVYILMFIPIIVFVYIQSREKMNPNYEPIPLWVILATTGLILVVWLCNLLILKKALDYRGYGIRSKDISMRRGLFFRKYRTVPFNNIQQVSVEQGLLARPFKLYRLEIEDASQSGQGLSIPGLTKERAHELKDFLLGQIS